MKERFVMLTKTMPTTLHNVLAATRGIEILYRGLPKDPWSFTHLDIGEGFAGAIVDHPALVANLLPHMDVGVFDYKESDGKTLPYNIHVWNTWRLRVDLMTQQALF